MYIHTNNNNSKNTNNLEGAVAQRQPDREPRRGGRQSVGLRGTCAVGFRQLRHGQLL